MKKIIEKSIYNILEREQKPYAKLKEINDEKLRSQIRGRLQENCDQYSSFIGEPLFKTEKVRSGKWTLARAQKKYIRYINNTFLVSDDNWLTLKEVKELDNEYVIEENQDNIFKAKLIQLIGSKKAAIILSELIKIRKLLNNLNKRNKTDNGYGNSFEVFAIATYYDISYEECINKYIINDDKDGKIDAIYYGEKENIYIYQIKVNNIDDISYNEMKKNYEMCLNGKFNDDNKDLYDFISKHKDLLKGKKVNYITISNNSKRQSNILPITIYEKYFQNKLLPAKNNHLVLIIQKPSVYINDDLMYNVSSNGKNFNFYISASDLIDSLLDALGIDKNSYDPSTIDISKYFSDNVRGILSPNKKMINTILEEPYNFVKYNNGINITGEVRDLNNAIEIKNPVINNGQQTITTLLRINKNLKDIVLSVKITNETDMTIKGKISQYSNDQVKVKAVDMLSLNPYIREIQEKILNKKYNNEQYFLEIYSSGKKSYYEVLQNLFESNHVIALSDFLKLYFSTQNKQELGAWKNTFNTQVEKTNINESFDLNKSLKICDTIRIYEDFLSSIDSKKKKDDLNL